MTASRNASDRFIFAEADRETIKGYIKRLKDFQQQVQGYIEYEDSGVKIYSKGLSNAIQDTIKHLDTELYAMPFHLVEKVKSEAGVEGKITLILTEEEKQRVVTIYCHRASGLGNLQRSGREIGGMELPETLDTLETPSTPLQYPSQQIQQESQLSQAAPINDAKSQQEESDSGQYLLDLHIDSEESIILVINLISLHKTVINKSEDEE
ncbi:hypothetical protein L218DRAFT_945974 [Marasmius fiardii PR-910]|nr:hypothetical protein L218DRAFT_945974 [Marasmius fiardii PR-910]